MLVTSKYHVSDAPVPRVGGPAFLGSFETTYLPGHGVDVVETTGTTGCGGKTWIGSCARGVDCATPCGANASSVNPAGSTAREWDAIAFEMAYLLGGEDDIDAQAEVAASGTNG
jgi:hypothetical protein